MANACRCSDGAAAAASYPHSFAQTYHLATVFPKSLQAGLWAEIPDLKMASNAPFGLTSFALSLLLVFR